MTCFNPKYAKYSYTKLDNGKISKHIQFIPRDSYYRHYKMYKETLDGPNKYAYGLLIIPCGKCIGCR